jgi:hypothetical protein
MGLLLDKRRDFDGADAMHKGALEINAEHTDTIDIYGAMLKDNNGCPHIALEINSNYLIFLC